MKKAHGKRMFSVFVLVFAVVLSASAAVADFYVIAVGKRAKRTILVSPQSTPGASGAALLNALDGITDASESNPYLIIIEPGIYDIGSNALEMKAYVDIQGSGENVTKITGNINGDWAGVVEGADNAELRFLTVENTGGLIYARAIYNRYSSPKMTNVTATASGGTDNRGVYNYGGSPTMTNVTATASGGTANFGVYNYYSSPAIRRSTMEGDTNSLYSGSGSTATVCQSTLIGGVLGGTKNKCVACDDGSGNALDADCL